MQECVNFECLTLLEIGLVFEQKKRLGRSFFLIAFLLIDIDFTKLVQKGKSS